MDEQEKVETPAGGIAGDVGCYAAVEALPTFPCMYGAQRVPHLLSDTSPRFRGGHLKLDFEKVEGVHAEDGDDARTESSCSMVLGGG